MRKLSTVAKITKSFSEANSECALILISSSIKINLINANAQLRQEIFEVIPANNDNVIQTDSAYLIQGEKLYFIRKDRMTPIRLVTLNPGHNLHDLFGLNISTLIKNQKSVKYKYIQLLGPEQINCIAVNTTSSPLDIETGSHSVKHKIDEAHFECALFLVPSEIDINQLNHDANMRAGIFNSVTNNNNNNTQINKIYLVQKDKFYLIRKDQNASVRLINFKAGHDLNQLLEYLGISKSTIEQVSKTCKFIGRLTYQQNEIIKTTTEYSQLDIGPVAKSVKELKEAYEIKMQSLRVESQKLTETQKNNGDNLFEIAKNIKKITEKNVETQKTLNAEIAHQNSLYQQIKIYNACIKANEITSGIFSKTYKAAYPIHQAVHDDNMQVLKTMCHQHPNQINLQDGECRSTALHYAVQYGQTDMVKFLLELGAAFDIPDQDGDTSLTLDSTGVVKHFYKTRKNQTEFRPYYERLLNLMREYERDPQYQYFENFKALVIKCQKAEISFNVCYEDGYNLLHHATEKALPKMVELLLQTDIDLNAENKAGITVLDIADLAGDEEDMSIKTKLENIAEQLKTAMNMNVNQI